MKKLLKANDLGMSLGGLRDAAHCLVDVVGFFERTAALYECHADVMVTRPIRSQFLIT